MDRGIHRCRVAFIVVALALAMIGCRDDSFPGRELTGESFDSGPTSIRLNDQRESTLTGLLAGGDSIFFHRIAGALARPEGGSIVALAGLHTLAFVDESGELEMLVGRQGNGPGEFQYIAGLFHAGGHGAAVWDASRRSVSLFSHDGRFTDHVSLSTGGPEHGVGVLFIDSHPHFVTTSVTIPVGHVEDDPAAKATYNIWDLSGERVAIVEGPMAQPDPRYLPLTFEQNGRPFVVSTTIPAGCLPSVLAATDGERLLIADALQGELFAYYPDGRAELVYQTARRSLLSEAAMGRINETIETMIRQHGQVRSGPGPAGPVTLGPSRLIEASRAALLARIGEPGDPVAAAWTELFVDGSSRIWLKRATCYPDDGEAVWDVLGGDGQPVAEVVVPEDVALLNGAGSRIFGHLTDSLGVESFAVFRFEF